MRAPNTSATSRPRRRSRAAGSSRRRRVLPEIVGRHPVEHRAPRRGQHRRQQLHQERRLQVHKSVPGQQAGHHVGVLGRRSLAAQRRQHARSAGRGPAPPRGCAANAHPARPQRSGCARAWFADDLVEQRQDRRLAPVHDRQAADLDHVRRSAGCARTGLPRSPAITRLVHQRLAHQARGDVLRARSSGHSCRTS